MDKRDVRHFEPTWFDRHFKKALKELTKKEKKRRLEELANLIEALAQCRHPTSDPSLHKYNPKAYRGVINAPDIYEYSCRYPMRIVVRYVDDCVLLLTVTLKHDHDRMKRLLKNNRQEIDGWES